MQKNIDWDAYLSTRRVNSYTDRDAVRPYLHGTLLEIGCGYGSFAAWCARECGCVVSGVDPSPMAIAEATDSFPEIDFFVATAEKLPFADGTFDTIVSLEVVEHIKNPRRFFAEALRVLRPGGRMIIQTPNYPTKRLYDVLHWLTRRKPNPWDDPTHVSPFSAGRLERLARESGFQIVALVGRNILGDRRSALLRRLKRARAARLLWQKTILIAEKSGQGLGSIDKPMTSQ